MYTTTLRRLFVKLREQFHPFQFTLSLQKWNIFLDSNPIESPTPSTSTDRGGVSGTVKGCYVVTKTGYHAHNAHPLKRRPYVIYRIWTMYVIYNLFQANDVGRRTLITFITVRLDFGMERGCSVITSLLQIVVSVVSGRLCVRSATKSMLVVDVK